MTKRLIGKLRAPYGKGSFLVLTTANLETASNVDRIWILQPDTLEEWARDIGRKLKLVRFELHHPPGAKRSQPHNIVPVDSNIKGVLLETTFMEGKQWKHVARQYLATLNSTEERVSIIAAKLRALETTEWPILVKLVNDAELTLLDQELGGRLLEVCFRDEELWERVLPQYLGSLTKEERQSAILTRLQTISNHERSRLLDFIEDSELISPDNSDLRVYIDHARRWKLVQLALESGADESWILALLGEVPGSERENFWSGCPIQVPLDSALFRLASDQGKIVLLKRLYKMLFGSVPPKLASTSILASELLPQLDESDRQLARRWTQRLEFEDTFKAEYAKMLSARAAEKAVAKVLSRLGYVVDDVAITQLTGEGDWSNYDLLLNGREQVDVKNARTSVNSENRYVELVVAKFKRTRSWGDVMISGIVSPYLSLDDIEQLSGPRNGEVKAYNKNKVLKYIGNTDRAAIERLKKLFNSRDLKWVLQIRNQASSEEHSVLPPYLFDFSDDYYSSLRDHLARLVNIKDRELPSSEQLRMASLKPPFAMFLAANRSIPEDWQNDVHGWRSDFLELIQNLGPLTLPKVFLAILKHFSLSVQRAYPDYSPQHYADLLYYGDLPAGRSDPLGLISDLIASLATLWEQKETIGLHQFTEFEFRGLGILKGKRRSDGRMITLMAYCGGKIPEKGKCGFPFLVLGAPNIQTCPDCGYLICPKCGSCKYIETNGKELNVIDGSKSCQRGIERQNNWTELPTERPRISLTQPAYSEGCFGYEDHSSLADVDDIPF